MLGRELHRRQPRHALGADGGGEALPKGPEGGLRPLDHRETYPNGPSTNNHRAARQPSVGLLRAHLTFKGTVTAPMPLHDFPFDRKKFLFSIYSRSGRNRRGHHIIIHPHSRLHREYPYCSNWR
jgi:hypothetical protein